MNDLVFPEKMDPESPEYKALAAQVLRKIKPGAYGPVLYNEIARLSMNLAMEAVALRVNSETNKIEVFMRRRGDSEMYPLQWHAAGAVMRVEGKKGEGWRQLANRLSGEFGTNILWYEEIGELFTEEARGPFLSKIFLVELKDKPKEDVRHRWYAVDELPQVTVDHHEEYIIPLATMIFAAKNNIRVRARIEFINVPSK